jgi:tetratricopeptide (TPR) repeat protein
MSSYVKGNYHPLTMLSYCWEYNKSKLNPKPYHVHNLILHLLNTLLVLYFIWLLTQQQWVAFITALLFAIHPMHVESVAWVSERKDVLYSFFYLAALCTYILYQQKEKQKTLLYSLTFVLFCLGVLSKAMTVTLPIAFIAIDYFLDKKFTTKTIMEKLPFIIVSFIFGYIAVEAQKSANYISTAIAEHRLLDRILFISYEVMMYLWKLILPTNLSCFYDYPVKQNGMYSIAFYIAPILMLVLTFLVYKSMRFGKDIMFGCIFFLITIVLVLQILPVGGAIISDRYSYLPYIGIFFIVARWINNLIENKTKSFSKFKIPSIAVLTIFSMMCCYFSFQRTKVWKNTISLWTDAIEKFDGSAQSFNARGDGYSYIKQYDNAIIDLSRAVELKHDYPDAYYNRGRAYFYLGKYNEAIQDYTSAIQYNPSLSVAYYNRSGTFFTTQNFPAALKDALKAKQLGYAVDPRFIDAIKVRMDAEN